MAQTTNQQVFKGDEASQIAQSQSVTGGADRSHRSRKANLSVDIGKAQNFRDIEGLPTVDQGHDPKQQSAETPSTDPPKKADQLQDPSGAVPNDEGKEKEKDLPRDSITGRRLAENGVSCLHCVEKGVRCTLKFYGQEDQPKCVACKRSNSRYCLRLRSVKLQEFSGPPWNNPNFISVGDNLSAKEMEELLKEHYLGPQTYTNGNYVYEADRKNMALPPFNGSDLPLGERPENWENLDWKDQLPIFRNQSLYPRSIPPSAGLSLPEQEQRDLTPVTATVAPSADNVPQESPQHEPKETPPEDASQYLRHSRKYPPREVHLKDELGETW
ncbi:hypothetical protein F5B20DRAFT_575306 [Whalleya microplaca]|nr:hypothetical protein F5B20DRAFT_575306 [Whalleya microplaca]